MNDLNAVAEILYRGRYAFPTEKRLQELVEQRLIDHGLKFQREFRLSSRDRVDFLIEGGIALELKVQGAKLAIYRQLARYAEHEAVTGLILLGNKAMGLPESINGKPTAVVPLTRSIL